MRRFFRFLIAFLAVTGAVAVLTGVVGLEFGHGDYWDHHGLIFLVMIAFFPRLTLLFSSVPTGGLLWWLGWLFAPRILVAVLATMNYWYQNPILVVIAWLVAFGGESSEKYAVVQRTSWRDQGSGYDSAKWVQSEKGSSPGHED
ncbi:MAG: hypothetical protein ACXWPM_00830 [Bdellovibrionota bacterium]